MALADYVQRVIFRVKDEASDKTDKIEGKFASLKKSALAIGAAFVGVGLVVRKFVRILNDAAVAAGVQEKAVTKLNIALGRTGSVEAYSKALQAQAAELQKLGQAGDEVIISTQALLAEMGVAPERLAVATEAAVNLSAAFGITLENAARNVGKTIGGLSGELGELIPELRGMQEAGTLAGQGIEFINQKFTGAAAGQIDTYTAAITRNASAMGDLNEALGEGQTDAGVVASLNRWTASIQEAAAATSGSNLVAFFSELKEVAIVNTAQLIDNTVALGQFLHLLKSEKDILADTAAATKILNAQRDESAAKAKLVADGEAFIAQAIKATVASLNEQVAAFSGVQEAENAFLESVKLLGVVLEDEVNAAIEKNNALLDESNDRLREGLITRNDFEAITRAVMVADQELAAGFRDGTEALGELGSGFDEAATQATNYAGAIDSATVATSRLTTANNASPLRSSSSSTASRSFGNKLDKRQTVLGGTRVNGRLERIG